MTCPVCEADNLLIAETCPQCGARVHSAPRADSTRVVEGTAQRGPVSEELPLAEGAAETIGDAGPASDEAGQVNSDTSLVVARPSLPAVLWQQPAVRAVAQAGVGAVALTLGMRLLRSWLARPQASRQLVTTALPMVADLLEQGKHVTSPASPQTERGTEIVETFIYMQRVIRRR